MNELVIMQNQQAVTSSMNIATDFGKQHGHVLRDIRGLQKDVSNFGEMFSDAMEPDSYGRNQTVVYMNRDGFTLLAMGFTGKRALEFKLKYIEAFNKMEEQLKQPSNTKLLLQAALEQEERIEVVETDVKYLKDNMRIDSAQEQRIRDNANRVVVKCLGGKNSAAYKSISRKVFPLFWKEFKRYFEVPRYGDLPKVRFDEAIEFINAWTPSTSLKFDIRSMNNQQHLKLVE